MFVYTPVYKQVLKDKFIAHSLPDVRPLQAATITNVVKLYPNPDNMTTVPQLAVPTVIKQVQH